MKSEKKWLKYEHLNWLEVKGLEKNFPFVLPISRLKMNSIRRIREQLIAISDKNKYHPVIFLPDFHYCSNSDEIISKIRIKPDTVRKFLGGIEERMKEQGFEHIYFLDNKNKLSNLEDLTLPKQTEIKKDKSLLEKVAVIPLGHTEQHGFHLPLNTDTSIFVAICKNLKDKKMAKKAAGLYKRKSIEKVPNNIFILPVLPYGVSAFVKEFYGTLTIDGRVYEDFLFEIGENLIKLGFDKLSFLCGHGGNASYICNAVKWLADRYPSTFICSPDELVTKEGVAILKRYRESIKPGGMGHAGELETSMMLYICPELVKMNLAIDEGINQIKTRHGYTDWGDGPLGNYVNWKDDTITGALGQPSFASEKKGKVWLEAVTKEYLNYLDEIFEHQDKRYEKRELLGY